MKLSKEDLTDILEFLDNIEDFRPVIKQIIDTIKSFGPELGELPEKLRSYMVKSRIKSVAQYEDAGFNREEAIAMTMADMIQFDRALNKASNKKK
jgi:hypothetical protein